MNEYLKMIEGDPLIIIERFILTTNFNETKHHDLHASDSQ